MPESSIITIPADALDFSGLPPHATQPGTEAFMHAAFQLFMPGVDVGIDLSKEYAAAKGECSSPKRRFPKRCPFPLFW